MLSFLVGSFLIIVALVIYWAPSLICINKPRLMSVGVINLFLGWTVLGWVICLAWAVAPDSKRSV